MRSQAFNLFLPLLGPVLYLMLLAGQASCAVLVPACVKLKVSVWMVRQLFSLFQCSRGRGPINLEGTLSPGSLKGHSPQGEGSGETLSLNLPGYVSFYIFFIFFIPKCHFHTRVSWPTRLRPPLIRSLIILCLPC